jgi:hypothetical protein
MARVIPVAIIRVSFVLEDRRSGFKIFRDYLALFLRIVGWLLSPFIQFFFLLSIVTSKILELFSLSPDMTSKLLDR